MILRRGRQPGRTAPGWLFLLAAWLALFPATALAGETITRAEYLRRVDAAAQSLSSGRAVEQAAAELQEITAVRLPSGREVSIEPLLSGKERPEIALARLRLTAQQLAAAENDQVAERLALLDDALAAPELRSRESILDRLQRWLEGWSRQVDAGASEAASQAASGLDWVIGIVGGLIALVVISFLIQAVVRDFVVDAEARRRRAEGEEEALTAAGARQQAAELARAGDFRAAVRRLYLATLLSLEDHGLLRYDRSLTNREMLARLESGSPVRAGLAPVVETFEQVWYGVQEPDQQTFNAYRAAVDATGSAILVAAHEPREAAGEAVDGAA